MATASTISDRRYELLDAELLLRDYEATAATGDTNGDAVEFYAEKYISYEFVIQNAAIGGTVDASNYWTVVVEGDITSSFSDPVTLASVQLPATAGVRHIPMSGERAKELRLADSVASQIKYVRVKLDETGTTAGNLTVGAFIDCLK